MLVSLYGRDTAGQYLISSKASPSSLCSHGARDAYSWVSKSIGGLFHLVKSLMHWNLIGQMFVKKIRDDWWDVISGIWLVNCITDRCKVWWKELFACENNFSNDLNSFLLGYFEILIIYIYGKFLVYIHTLFTKQVYHFHLILIYA